MNSKPLFIHDDMDEYFYNRKNDIKKLEYQINSLNYSLPQQILLTGHGGVGKTYLLKKIMADIGPSIVCTYIDISKIYALEKRNLTLEILLIELLNEMNQSIQINQYDSKYKARLTELIDNLKLEKYDFQEIAETLKMSIPKAETDYRKLSQFVMEFPQRIVDDIDEINGFVIMMDEFQMLRKIKDLDKFFWMIRIFSQIQHNVSYIFVGSMSQSSDVINELNGERGPFGGRLQQITIDPFTKEETQSYFRDKMGEIEFTEEGFESFYKFTRGIPLYINSFYNVMDSRMLYTREAVTETFYNSMDQILIKSVKVWSGLNENEKSIVRILADENSLAWGELLEKTNFSRGTFNKYLKSLKYKGVVAFAGRRCSIEDEMLKTWLQHEKEVNGFYPF